MIKVFLSYSRRDHYFAELLSIKLSENDIHLWQDQGSLRSGSDWRQGIEGAISASSSVLVALSSHSAESSYVTYEWAYALGGGRSIIPLKLSECAVHPKLETIQHLDFSIPGALPWNLLVQHIREIDAESEPPDPAPNPPDAAGGADDPAVNAILSYLNQRGYQMASFDRLAQRVDESLTHERLRTIIDNNKTIFRRATLRGAKPGLAKIVP